MEGNIFLSKDFTFICPTEIVEYAKLNNEFLERDCVVLGGSTDNEHCKLAGEESIMIYVS